MKAETLKTNGSDDYAIKKQNEFVQESEDTRANLKIKFKTHIDDLDTLINEITDEQLKTLEEFTNAKNILAEASKEYDNSIILI